jgi:hypothetical protein
LFQPFGDCGHLSLCLDHAHAGLRRATTLRMLADRLSARPKPNIVSTGVHISVGCRAEYAGKVKLGGITPTICSDFWNTRTVFPGREPTSAKVADPKSMADDDGGRSAHLLLLCSEQAPENWIHAEYPEEVT